MQKVLDFQRNGINYHVFRFNGSSMPDASTVKNVGAYETIEHAVSQGANVVVNVSSGNKADALKTAAEEYNAGRALEDKVKVVHIIGNKSFRMAIDLRDSENYFAYSLPIVFHEMNSRWLTPEDRISLAREYLEKNPETNFKIKGIFDATHYVPNKYLRQAQEILQQKFDGRYLDFFGVQIGTGMAYSAFHTALRNMRARGEETGTKLIGIAPEGEHPVFHRFVVPRKRTDGTLEHVIEGYNPASKADKLSCPYTDLLPVLDRARSEGNPFIEVDNGAIEMANKTAFKLGKRHDKKNNPLDLEYSGSVGFALADGDIAQKLGIKPGDNVGIFVTGKGLYATTSSDLDKKRAEMRKEFIYRCLEGVKKTAAGILIFSAGMAGFIGVDYLAKRISPAYARFQDSNERAYRIRQEKTDAIKNILSKDNSMLEAMKEIEKKYENTFYGIMYTDYPEPVLDEIILRYLELNREKIQHAKDPRDAEPFNRLRYLVWQSQWMKGIGREPVK